MRTAVGGVFGTAVHVIGGTPVGRLTLPPGAVFYAKNISGVLTDIVGDSSITFATGDASDLMAATFSFSADAITLQADSDEGGDIFFDSADSMAPIVRSGVEWYNLLNGSYCWIGPRGIAIYTADMIAYQSKIQRVLGYYYAPLEMLDSLEMFDSLEMI